MQHCATQSCRCNRIPGVVIAQQTDSLASVRRLECPPIEVQGLRLSRHTHFLLRCVRTLYIYMGLRSQTPLLEQCSAPLLTKR